MDTILNVSKLCSGYGELPVLHDIDLHVKRGEIVSVVGANGAGKTTLLLTITGHLRAQSGQVLFDGQDVSAEPAHAAAARSASVPSLAARSARLLCVPQLRAAARRRCATAACASCGRTWPR
jgi:ABC-type branched-subunit amino acid transport system ATPase component